MPQVFASCREALQDKYESRYHIRAQAHRPPPSMHMAHLLLAFTRHWMQLVPTIVSLRL